VFAVDPQWSKPSNFLLIEVLYYLAINRKQVGQIGLQGYFTCDTVARELQRLGYVYEDVLGALNMLLQRKLIGADHMNFTFVRPEDSVRILASGFMHVRILSGRVEYLFGILPTTPLFERDVALQLGEFVKQESVRGKLGAFQRLRAVETFYDYLSRQAAAQLSPFNRDATGTAYVLGQMSVAIEHFKNVRSGVKLETDPLDF
jgi:hypothetical protein